MSPGTLRQRHHDSTLEALLAATESVLKRKGFQSATMRDIAAEAGCSPATLYQYFTDKQGLLEAITEKYCCVMLTRLEEAERGIEDPIDRLRAIARLVIEYHDLHREVFRTILSMTPQAASHRGPDVPESVRSRVVERYRTNLSLIRTAQERGLMRTDLSAEDLQGVLHQLVMNAAEVFDPGQKVSADEQFRVIWGIVESGMGIRPKPAETPRANPQARC